MFPCKRPLAVALFLVAATAVACGGDGDGDTSGEGGSPAASSSSPSVAMPVSRFALSLEDLPKGYLTDRAGTFVLDAKSYGKALDPESPARGEASLGQWGYLGGYETAFEPEQRVTAVLNGQYYAAVEVHLFKDEAGAREAFAYFDARLQRSQSQRVSVPSTGNQSSAWKLTSGKIPESSIDATYHRIVFRRGNVVSIVQTWGSDAFMRVDVVQGLAQMVDQKVLGARPAVEPTPLAQPVATPTVAR